MRILCSLPLDLRFGNLCATQIDLPMPRLINKLNKKDQRRPGRGIGIGLLRQPFVVDKLLPTGEHSQVYSGIWIVTPKAS